ncbi:flavin reductase (NADPH)-like [Hemiscyllium ocellatum]|uniref:flavin reductase (NADPH)-like n=1 Tax=Hemiscyllium ocellatum TaxID=170820 RepID=UPI00296715BB|nr:flavin reductase (NADPH)-like [Hemiscyllium ocellatum]
MKLLILGATGQTGQLLVRQALEQGHVVKAVVRTPSKLTIQHDNLKVVKANIFSADSLQGHFNDQDVIMCCLGFPIRLFSGHTEYTESMKAIIPAMRKAEVTRIIAMSSWYTKPKTSHQTTWMLRSFLTPVIHSLLINMQEVENYLNNECKDLNWTVVKPPGLQKAPRTDKELLIHEGYYEPDLDRTPVANPVKPGDIARFMLSLLKDDSCNKRAVAVVTV